MRLRPTIWIIVCALILAGAWLLFFHGANRQLARNSAGSAPNSPVAGGAPTKQSARTAANVPASVVASSSLTKTNPFPFRLSNTTNAIGQLENDRHAILLDNAFIDTRAPINLAIPKNLQASGDPGAYIVQAPGRIDAAFRAMLAQNGAQYVSYIPNDAYLVTMSPSAAQAIADDGYTVLPYEPYYKVPSSLLAAIAEGQPQVINRLEVAAYPDTATATEAALENAGLKIAGQYASPFGEVFTVLNVRDAAALARLPQVQRIEPVYRRELANDLSRPLLGVSPDSITQSNYLNLSGSNVLVEIDDSGVDTNHPDLAGRIFFTDPAEGYDTDGHGTFVGGEIAGNGFESTTVTNAAGSFNPGTNGQYRGKAPLAKLLAMNFQTNDLDLQETAGLSNAPISNNSWGYDGDNAYDLEAASYDAATRDSLPGVTGSQPVLFVFSAGNSGSGDDSSDPGGGFADTIVSPATAKDVITVGAIQEDRGITNQVTNADGSVSAPWADETSTSYRIAGFSSRGNVGIGTEGTYGRFKPDVVAPGTFTISTRSPDWDQAAYFYQNPLNDDQQEYDDVVVGPDSLWANAFPYVPTNAVQVSITVEPSADSPDLYSTNLSIWVGMETDTGYPYFTTSNVFSMPPDAPGLSTVFNTESFVGFNYGISNSTSSSVTFDLITDIITTNNPGNEPEVLSNLDNSIGPWYRYESGTSMSAGDISGVLALMEDFFINHTAQTNPSPALLKALLINGAQVTGYYDFQVDNSINYEGWGLPYLPDSLPPGITNQAGVPCGSFFQDQSPTNALATGDSHTYNVAVAPSTTGQSLRVTLAWTDPPGNPAAAIKLVNDLELVVTNLDDSTNPVIYFGNDIPASSVYNESWTTNSLTNGFPVDTINNVQNVYLPPGAGTNFSVTVVGRAVNVNAVTAQTNNSAGLYAPNIVQDYALVISCGTNTITVTDNGIVSNPTGDQDITVVTNDNLPLLNQFVGANSPLMGTNTVSLGGPNTGFATNAILTVGQTNQWHFYVVTNTTGYTNAAFVTFLPPTLSVPRMGVFAGSAANATQPEADLDLYVAGPGDPNAFNLTNLDLNVISNCVNGLNGDSASLDRGGTEFVVFTNSAMGQVYYIGVKAEDQEASEYGFLPIFTAQPFSQNNANGQVIYGVNVPEAIPDGSPQHPGSAYIFAFALTPMEMQDVIVSNQITHQNIGDLIGTLSHNGRNDVLNNHVSIQAPPPPGPYDFVYDDSQSPVPGSQPSDGPGTLGNFTGQEALGAWILTETDDSLTQTGSVDSLAIQIEPHLDPLKGLTGSFSIQGGALYENYVDVPIGATNLTISLTNFTGAADVQMFIEYGAQPTTNNFDEMIDIPAGAPPIGGSIVINQATTPPLRPGIYYITIYNTGAMAQNVGLYATVGISTAGVPTVDYDSTDTPLPILDDAVMTDSIDVPDTDPIAEVNVGIRVDHPRISDLVFHLIDPNGNRYLLMENRGGSSTNGAGLSYSITNIVPVSHNGGDEAYTNNINTGETNGTLTLSYDLYELPDTIDVYYQGTDIWSYHPAYTGNDISGTTNISWGPGTSTIVTIVINQGGNTNYPTTAWTYTVTSPQEKYAYLMFTEDTNLTTTPIKFAPPPFVPMLLTNISTNTISDFESVAAGDYTNGYTVNGWTVTSNEVSVVYDPTNSYQGSNFLALANGVISNNLATTPGQTYTVSFAYRGPGIVSLWRGENSTADSVGGNNGFVSNNVTYVTYDAGEVGQAFDLSTNGFLFIPASTSLNVGPGPGFTVEGWINPRGIPNTQLPIFEWSTDYYYNEAAFDINFLSPGNLFADLLDSNLVSHEIMTGANVVTTNVFQHVALTYDRASGNAFIYYNGAKVASANFGSIVPWTTGPLLLGGRINVPDPNQNFRFNGKMDEMSLYGRALSDAEINAIYQKSTAGKYDQASAFPQNLAEAGGSVGTTNFTISGDNTNWQVATYTFRATGSTTPFVMTGLEPGVLLDDFMLTGTAVNPTNLYYLPEQSLAPLVGQSPQGTWQLEIQDDRAGAYDSNNMPMLDSWELQFVLASTNALLPAPIFNYSPTNIVMDELTTNWVTNSATAVNGGQLTYTLLNSPAWASIDTNGVITLTPGEYDGPGEYTITTVVTETSTAPESATNSFMVIVNEVNSPPFWPTNVPSATNYTIAALSTLSVVNTAEDTDYPPNTLTYTLSVAPAVTNAFINPNGIITWSPGTNQAGTNYTFTTVVTDTNMWALTNKSLSATNFFTVTVIPPLTLTDGRPQTNSVYAGSINFYVVNVPTNAIYATNLLLSAVAPVNVWFSTNLPPTITNSGDVELMAGSQGGTALLGTNGSPVNMTTAYIVPGGTYYLGIQNTNSFDVTNYAVEVDFDLLTPINLTNGVAQTNTVAAGGIDYYAVYVPTNVDFATNILDFAGLPLNVWFNQTGLPVGANPPDYQLLGGVTSGIGSPVLGAGSTPPLVVGQTYYLAVQNTNSVAVNYAIEVDFHYLPPSVSTNALGGFGPITTDGTNLFIGGYLTNVGNAIFAMTPTNGAVLAPIYSNLTDSAWGLAVNDTNLYWINPTNGGSPNTTAIFTGDTGGSMLTTDYPTMNIFSGSDIASDGTQLFVADEFRGWVFSLPFDLSSENQLGGNRYAIAYSHSNSLAVANGMIYVADSGKTGSVTPQIVSIATNGVAFTTNYLGAPLISPSGIAARAGALFVTDPGATNTIWMFPATTNGTPTVIVSGAPFRVLNRITYLNHALYVTDNDTNGANGMIYQVALDNPPPVFGAISVKTNTVILNWTAPIYDEFQVQWTTNLASPITWGTFSNTIISTSGQFTYSDTNAPVGMKFYRLLDLP